jgi:hypothetical protein
MIMKRLIALIVGIILAAGCGVYWDDYYPYYGYDSGEIVYYEGGVVGAGADPTPMATLIPAALTPESMAQNALSNFKARLTDRTCLISEKVTGNMYEVDMKSCKGPLGLKSVSGKVSFTFTEAAGGGTQIAVASSGLNINRYVVEIASTVIRTLSGGTTTLSVTAKGKGVSPDLEVINHEGTYTATMTAADECRTLDGKWKVTSNGRSWDATMTGHKRCSHLCPSSGGQMLMEDKDGDAGHKIKITYDGSGTAKWEWPGNKTGTMAQYCGDNI